MRLALGASLTWYLLSFCAMPLFAGSAKIEAKVALFPVGSFEVTSNQIEGKLEKSGDHFRAEAIKVPVASLQTGIKLRDQHLREKLKEEKYSHIVVSKIEAKGGLGKAQLTIGEVSNNIEFKLKELAEQQVQANFKIRLPDYKITGISYKGVGVEDEVEITAILPYENK